MFKKVPKLSNEVSDTQREGGPQFRPATTKAQIPLLFN